MAKRIIAVNAGPRKGWNTETLISEASKGAESTGAVVERFDLFRLERYTGCISCFGCKKNKFKKIKDNDEAARKELTGAMVKMLGIRPKIHLLAPKSITRSEGKAVRVIDKRKLHD